MEETSMSDFQNCEEETVQQEGEIQTEPKNPAIEPIAENAKKTSSIGSFFRGYKVFKTLSAKSKFLHIAIPAICLLLIVGILASGDGPSGIQIVESGTAYGYEFDATLEDFIDNWNKVTEELYGKSSVDDISLRSITYVREEMFGDVTVSVYSFDPFLDPHMGVGFYVNKKTGNIIQLNYTIDKNHVDKASDKVKETYFIKNVRRVYGCLGLESDILNRVQRAVDSDRSHDYKNHILTVFGAQQINQTDMYFFQMYAVTDPYYKSISGE